ncbi:MAG: Ectoine hydroxylase-related dioxygenase, phytanoyl-CoA dioxygenase (PhyH) family [Bacteroidota bacterium]|nr:Ectoine hydroxylase-related dioxygenase, phytanoyl-CoA dioxygenase (PhyH) family [Bacteroidota bacterium]
MIRQKKNITKIFSSEDKTGIKKFSNLYGKYGMTKEEFLERFNKDGYVILPDVLSIDLIIKLKEAILGSLELQAAIIGKSSNRYFGKLLCAPVFGNTFPVFFELLKEKEWLQPVQWLLDELFIINLYASSCIPPDNDKASQYIHVDLPRYIPGYHFGMGVLIATDDFTKENGATKMLKGSHLTLIKPEEEYFTNNSEQFICKAGSILYFNPNLWHATGYNSTRNWRTAAVLGFTRPWMKQYADIPRLLKKYNVDISSYSQDVFQLLGYYSQPPDNMEDFSVPLEKRMFRQKVV